MQILRVKPTGETVEALPKKCMHRLRIPIKQWAILLYSRWISIHILKWLLQAQAACCTDLLPFDVASSSFDLLDYGYCSDEYLFFFFASRVNIGGVRWHHPAVRSDNNTCTIYLIVYSLLYMFIYQHLPKGACLNGWCIIGTSYHPVSIPTRKGLIPFTTVYLNSLWTDRVSIPCKTIKSIKKSDNTTTIFMKFPLLVLGILPLVHILFWSYLFMYKCKYKHLNFDLIDVNIIRPKPQIWNYHEPRSLESAASAVCSQTSAVIQACKKVQLHSNLICMFSKCHIHMRVYVI